MGQGYNTSLHNQNLHTTTFLPMLCSRPSIKGVYIPKSQDPPSANDNNEDPLSPKISCIGQVKRNNKIIGFPNHTTATNSHSKLMAVTTNKNSYYSGSFSYFKLKMFFSRKSLTTTASPATTSAATCRKRGTRRELIKNDEILIGSKTDERSDKEVNIVDLDPPLPVPIKSKQEGDKAENLWKRRFGGAELMSLQLQQIQLNRHRHQMEPTTV